MKEEVRREAEEQTCGGRGLDSGSRVGGVWPAASRSVPPAMRFCKSVNYPVYRPSETQTFAELDFDSHAVFKKIVPHMRISERHFELPVIEKCRAHFREFLRRAVAPVGMAGVDQGLDDFCVAAAAKRSRAVIWTTPSSTFCLKWLLGRSCSS